jgi:hypothetical protein
MKNVFAAMVVLVLCISPLNGGQDFARSVAEVADDDREIVKDLG